MTTEGKFRAGSVSRHPTEKDFSEKRPKDGNSQFPRVSQKSGCRGGGQKRAEIQPAPRQGPLGRDPRPSNESAHNHGYGFGVSRADRMPIEKTGRAAKTTLVDQPAALPEKTGTAR